MDRSDTSTRAAVDEFYELWDEQFADGQIGYVDAGAHGSRGRACGTTGNMDLGPLEPSVAECGAKQPIQITRLDSRLGMTLEEFIVEGRAGTLGWPELCEQWLTHGARLAELDLPTPGAILPANTRPDPRSNREMTLHYVSREELRDRVEQDVSRVGMTLKEFIAEGKAGSLTDGNLRDLWLIYGDLIVEE